MAGTKADRTPARRRTRAEYARLARLFGAATSPTAVGILFALAEGECYSGALAEGARMSLASTSTTLARLHLVGLVARRREGIRVSYALTGLGRSVVAVAELATRPG